MTSTPSRRLAFLALLFFAFNANAQTGPLCFEAEYANRVAAPMEIWENPKCGAGACIGIREGAGAEQAYVKQKGNAVYGIRVPKTGRYTLWLRVRWQDVCSNSIYVSVDARPKRTLTDGLLGKWHWARGPLMRMKAGFHRFILSNREDGVWVDQIIVSPRPVPMPRGPQKATYVPGQDGPVPGSPPIAVSFTCTSRAARPKPLHSDLLTHRVYAPSVLATPHLSVLVFPNEETDFDVWLRNNTPRPCRGSIEVNPPAEVTVGPSRSVRWTFAAGQPLQRIRFRLRATEALPMAEHPLRIRINYGDIIVPALATVVRPFKWILAGPYPFSESFSISHQIKEEPAILAEAFGKAPLRSPPWRTVSVAGHYTEFGLLDLRRIFGETQQALVYALTVVKADRCGEAELFLSADDHCIAWVNGKEAARVETSLPATINCAWARVRVRQGRNRLLIKLSQRRGYWEFAARLVPKIPGMKLSGEDPDTMMAARASNRLRVSPPKADRPAAP